MQYSKSPDFPIPPHETWDLLDSSKISTYNDCPRQFFYSYILGLKKDLGSETGNHHLVFGSAMHLAMERLLTKDNGTLGVNYSDSNIQTAIGEFTAYFRQYINPEDDDSCTPKNPHFMIRAINEYCQNYKDDDFDVILIESFGAVPIGINPDGTERKIHFRLDTVIERTAGYFVFDHKTTRAFGPQWERQWPLNNQMATYTHAMHSLLDISKVRGAEINGIAMQIKETKFQRYPIYRKMDMMTSWIEDINAAVDLIQHDMESLKTQTSDSPAMSCFRRNSNACSKYFGCKFLPFCSLDANPLKRKTYDGFKSGEFWDPRKEQEKAKIPLTETPGDTETVFLKTTPKETP